MQRDLVGLTIKQEGHIPALDVWKLHIAENGSNRSRTVSKC